MTRKEGQSGHTPNNPRNLYQFEQKKRQVYPLLWNEFGEPVAVMVRIDSSGKVGEDRYEVGWLTADKRRIDSDIPLVWLTKDDLTARRLSFEPNGPLHSSLPDAPPESYQTKEKLNQKDTPSSP